MTESEASLPAVVLLSGGLDSAATAAIAAADGFAVHAVSFDYGQRHRFELDAAARVAGAIGAASHRVLRIDLRAIGGSALTDDIDVPKDQLDETDEAIPITYVPARNTIFLSYALACAEVIGSRDIFIGVNAIDYSGYPDCRPTFIAAFEAMANLATRHGVEPAATQGPATRAGTITIHTPLIQLTKPQIIRRGINLGVDFGLTHSCYDPADDGRPCAHCDSCLLRAAGFAELGIPDPALG